MPCCEDRACTVTRIIHEGIPRALHTAAQVVDWQMKKIEWCHNNIHAHQAVGPPCNATCVLILKDATPHTGLMKQQSVSSQRLTLHLLICELSPRSQMHVLLLPEPVEMINLVKTSGYRKILLRTQKATEQIDGLTIYVVNFMTTNTTKLRQNLFQTSPHLRSLKISSQLWTNKAPWSIMLITNLQDILQMS